MQYHDVKNSYIHLDPFHGGVLYAPEGDPSSTAVVLMHSDANYLGSHFADELAKRGYRTLCANVDRESAPLDDKLLDVKRCVEFVRKLPGVEKVVLLGHSGGATLMSAYQAVAEKGVGIFQDDHRIIKMRDIGELPAADAVMLLDSNWGNGVMTLLSLDPGIVDESCALKTDPAYDLTDPKNGYAPEGSTYTDEFVAQYQRGQHERNERLITAALERLAALDAHRGAYADDEPFILPAGTQFAPNNKLFPQDVRFFAHTKEAWPLVHGDGSVTREVVHSVRRPRKAHNFSPLYGMGAIKSSIRHYLTNTAVHTGDDFGYDETGIRGVDWDSCWCCTPGNVKHVCCPILIMGMTAGYEYIAAETIYNNCPSGDKTIAFMEGVNHMLFTDHDCETTPGQFGDGTKALFDFVAQWLEGKRL